MTHTKKQGRIGEIIGKWIAIFVDFWSSFKLVMLVSNSAMAKTAEAWSAPASTSAPGNHHQGDLETDKASPAADEEEKRIREKRENLDLDLD